MVCSEKVFKMLKTKNTQVIKYFKISTVLVVGEKFGYSGSVFVVTNQSTVRSFNQNCTVL